MALVVGARIDCCHTYTGLPKVTDVGLKDFSAALGSSSTITTVRLNGKPERLASCSYEWTHVCVGDGAKQLMLIFGAHTQAFARSRTLA